MKFGVCCRIADAAQCADAGFDFFEAGVAEAFAPHSMDTPVMMLCGYTVLAGICCWGWF